MKKPKLIVMAAGLGSRYGGLKQMESISDNNEIILDFACYDAVKAGFDEIIFIIKPEMEEVFKERVINPMSRYAKISYVFQELHQLPDGFEVPEGRIKPWGTCHAVMAAAELIDGPFAVINSDDYYGKSSFKEMYRFLANNREQTQLCMIGYMVQNTLSDQGSVTRGICSVKEGFLTDIQETKGLFRNDEGIILSEDNKLIDKDTVVSMNFWGFTESMLKEIIAGFPQFLKSAKADNLLTSEYLLPIKVGELLSEKKYTVRVLESTDTWYGVTYQEDRKNVEDALRKMKTEGLYPQKIWE